MSTIEQAARDLAIEADTVEILLRDRYPARAQSLRQKVSAMKAALAAAATEPLLDQEESQQLSRDMTARKSTLNSTDK
jgi:hypothetical protein